MNLSLHINCLGDTMDVILHSINKRQEAGLFDLCISVGGEPVRTFVASYEISSPTSTYCNLDQELFMRLSDLSVERFRNCAVYIMELTGIIGAFHSGKPIPGLPVQLGTTSFVTFDLKKGKTDAA